MTTLVLLSLLSATAPAPAFLPKARPYDAQHYSLEVRLGDDGAFNNKLTATLKALKPMSEIELDAYNLEIEMVLVDNQAADFRLRYEPSTKRGTITIKPKKPVPAGKEAIVEIAYHGKAGTVHEGLFSVTDPEDAASLPSYFTQFEPFYAQRFFPCNDQPADKATSEVLAIVDARYTVLSNGKKEKDEAFSEGGKNLRRVLWKQEQPMSTYLVALAVGVFQAVPVSDDPPMTIWVAPGRKERAFIAQDSLKGLFNFQTAFVGTKWPWAKLDVVALPRFYWSGMENTSIIFARESSLIVDHKNDQVARNRIIGLLAHELAHQFFGDFVTCKWWDDTWLNEGFATYLGDATEEDYHGNEMLQVERAVSVTEHYFKEEDGPRAHPLNVKASSPEEIFDSTSYTKGANVLRMLELWVGKPELKKALKAYLEKHAYGAADSEDFFKAVFDSTKKEKELKPFKEAWLKKKGYPVIFPQASYGEGKVTITIRQQPNHADEKGAFVFKLPIVIHRDTEPRYSKEETIVVDKPEVKVAIDVPAAPEWVNWNKELGALVRVDTASVSEEQWVDAARHDPDPVWRTLSTWTLLGELGNPKLTAETRPTDAALGAITDVLTRDPSPYVRVAVMDRLADSHFKRLPKDFAAIGLALSRRPEGLNEDPIGYIMVRTSAMQLLGKTDAPEGHQYLLEELGKRDIDINYLTGFAAGVGRIGSPAALTTLRAALTTQRPRGYAYFRRTAEALGSVEDPEVVAVLREVLKQNAGDNELPRNLFRRLDANFRLKATNEYAKLVRDLALDDTLSSELRSDLIWTLDDVKTDGAREALSTIVEKSTSERLKGAAKKTVDANFPVAAKAPSPKKK